jgi:hypothetical protein
VQATYYEYYWTKANGKQRYRADIRPFLKAFSSWKTPVFKGQFTHNDERLYLVNAVGDHYFFLATLDNEIIKKIDDRTLTLHDLKAQLSGGSAGFASYVNVREDHFGIACKVLSPRCLVFANYINDVVQTLGLPYRFHVAALTHKLERKDIPTLVRVGKVTLELQRENPLHEQFLQLMGAQLGHAYAEVGAIEVAIKPIKRGADLKPILKDVSDTIGSEGVTEFEARAVTALADKVVDIHLVGQGIVRHALSGNTDGKIQRDFDKQMGSDALLQKKLKEMRSADGFKKTSFADLDAPAKPSK